MGAPAVTSHHQPGTDVTCYSQRYKYEIECKWVANLSLKIKKAVPSGPANISIYIVLNWLWRRDLNPQHTDYDFAVVLSK